MSLFVITSGSTMLTFLVLTSALLQRSLKGNQKWFPFFSHTDAKLIDFIGEPMTTSNSELIFFPKTLIFLSHRSYYIVERLLTLLWGVYSHPINK